MSEYLIWSNEHGAWWAPNGMGYTRVIEEAGRYSPGDAERIVGRATVGGTLMVTRDGTLGQPLSVPPEVAVPVPADSP